MLNSVVCREFPCASIDVDIIIRFCFFFILRWATPPPIYNSPEVLVGVTREFLC